MNATIFGSSGLLGRALINTSSSYSMLALTSSDIDLRDKKSLDSFFLNRSTTADFDVWINAAAKVGGVKANSDFMGEFYRDNIDIGTNIIDCAKRFNVKKLVSVLSTCIYPDAPHVKYPITEDQLHNGSPHSSNFGYAYAKRMLDVGSRSYRRQWGCNFITAVPNNLYGVGDNYDLNNSHVIPALIRKFFEAHRDDRDVVIWGSGKPLREFTYSEDAARTIWWLTENYDGEDPVNIGNTEEIAIGDLAGLIGKIVGFKGNIKFDSSKPDGQFKKPTSNEKLRKLGYNCNYTSLEEGLSKTIEDFIKKYPNLRGIK